MKPFRFALIGATLGAVPWLPAIGTPFWADDYLYLGHARDALARGEFWSTDWLPDPDALFWRPLGVTLPWRIVAGVFGGQPLPAHVLSLVLAIVAGAAVGWCASVIAARAASGGRSHEAAFWAALLYTIHPARLLPIAWVSAASDSVMVLWSALALGCWFAGRRWIWLSVPLFAAALLSKEGALALPIMALALWWWLRADGGERPTAPLVAAAVVAVAAVWLAYRINRTAVPSPDSPYAQQLGLNVVRNVASLSAFFSGAPREALRFAIDAHSVPMAVWGAVCAILQASALVLLAQSARLTRRAAVALGVAAAAGAAPYVMLRWNCYEYYLSLSLMSYAVLAALGRHTQRRFRAGAALAVAATVVSAAVTYRLPYPSLLGRARDAEACLTRAAELVRGQPPPALSPRLYVRVVDDDRYRAMGRSTGLAIRLGLDPGDIREVFAETPLPAADRGRVPVLTIGKSGVTLTR